jgi:hypothetical protein
VIHITTIITECTVCDGYTGNCYDILSHSLKHKSMTKCRTLKHPRALSGAAVLMEVDARASEAQPLPAQADANPIVEQADELGSEPPAME